MIKLYNENDPKRVDPKHMVGREILIRDKEQIFIGKVAVINNMSYVYRFGITRKLSEFDGWATLPVEIIDEQSRQRELDRFFLDD